MVALGRATRQGQTIFAKNSDRPADECQPLVLHPRRGFGAALIRDIHETRHDDKVLYARGQQLNARRPR